MLAKLRTYSSVLCLFGALIGSFSARAENLAPELRSEPSPQQTEQEWIEDLGLPADTNLQQWIEQQPGFLLNRSGGTSVLIEVDKKTQRVYVTIGGAKIASFKCSTGAGAEFDTPAGEFKPWGTEKMHYSKKYDNSPMPYSTFFNGGIALHGTEHLANLGKRASHGCVRLYPESANLIYNWVNQYGLDATTVVVAENLGPRSGYGNADPVGKIKPTKPAAGAKKVIPSANDANAPIDFTPQVQPPAKRLNILERLLKKLNHEA